VSKFGLCELVVCGMPEELRDWFRRVASTWI